MTSHEPALVLHHSPIVASFNILQQSSFYLNTMNSQPDSINLNPIAHETDEGDFTDEEDWANHRPAANACSAHGADCDCGVGSSSSSSHIPHAGDPSTAKQKYRAPYSSTVSDMILLRAIQEFEPLMATARGDKSRRWKEVARACRAREQEMLGTGAGLHWASATEESVRKRWIRLTQRLDVSTRRLDNSTGSTEDLSEVEKLVKEILVRPEAQALSKTLHKRTIDDQRMSNYLVGKRVAVASMRTNPSERLLNSTAGSPDDAFEEDASVPASSLSPLSSTSTSSTSPLRSSASRGFTSLLNSDDAVSKLTERLDRYDEEMTTATDCFNAGFGQLRDSFRDSIQQLVDAQKETTAKQEAWMKQLTEMNIILANIISNKPQ